MPTYIYKAVNKGCTYCQDGFELKQALADKPVKKCPKCGALVKKAPTTFTFQMK